MSINAEKYLILVKEIYIPVSSQLSCVSIVLVTDCKTKIYSINCNRRWGRRLLPLMTRVKQQKTL